MLSVWHGSHVRKDCRNLWQWRRWSTTANEKGKITDWVWWSSKKQIGFSGWIKCRWRTEEERTKIYSFLVLVFQREISHQNRSNGRIYSKYSPLLWIFFLFQFFSPSLLPRVWEFSEEIYGSSFSFKRVSLPFSLLRCLCFQCEREKNK